MPARTERVSFEGFQIADVLNKKFTEKLSAEFGKSVIPVGLVLIKEPATPITINHENQKEIEERIVHVFSRDEETLQKMIKVLESDGNGR
ncbi:MAG: hypothetical protein J4431_04250 [Candidatus Aenigmarchaeota archaeon]|nr:hypothetical protein [Candidatus Aenigmarchaeota archaeon]